MVQNQQEIWYILFYAVELAQMSWKKMFVKDKWEK